MRLRNSFGKKKSKNIKKAALGNVTISLF